MTTTHETNGLAAGGSAAGELTAEEKEMAELRARIKKAGGGRHAWVEKIAGSFSSPEDKAAFQEAMRLSRAMDKPKRRKPRKPRGTSKK